MLVETVKLKSCANKIEECELAVEFEKCDVHNKVPSKPIGPPRQTKTSMQRIKMKEEEQESKSNSSNSSIVKPWRPNSSKTDAVPLREFFQLMRSISAYLIPELLRDYFNPFVSRPPKNHIFWNFFRWINNLKIFLVKKNFEKGF